METLQQNLGYLFILSIYSRTDYTFTDITKNATPSLTLSENQVTNEFPGLSTQVVLLKPTQWVFELRSPKTTAIGR